MGALNASCIVLLKPTEYEQIARPIQKHESTLHWKADLQYERTKRLSLSIAEANTNQLQRE
jgi:hypothetical protein